jgi:hypothetical protein
MENIKNKIIEHIKTIQGNGSFETSEIKKMIVPGIRITGVGEIGIPLSPLQVREIIDVAKKAPFGKGSQTITDTTVRSAWEVNADQISFHNEDWQPFMKKIITKVQEDLGIETDTVVASLYKLLIYEEGDFFLSHKDSEKEPGMFGTLIIALPSIHTGGELVIQFDGKEKTIGFSIPSSNYKMPYVAFFADCDHELKPITSGYRVVLVYNLLQSVDTAKLSQSKISSAVGEMATLLKSLPHSTSNKPTAILLEHQYTPANFSLESLKQHDKPRAELLLAAAKEANYFAALGLVSHYKMGQLEGDDYDYDYRRNYREDDFETTSDGSMGEVYEEYTTIEHWSNDDMPNLGTLHIEKEDIITDFEIGEDSPIEEEEEGYTGNAGMTIEYWYHYAAVILWPQNKHADLLFEASLSVQLKWLNYYYKRLNNTELNGMEISKQIIRHFSEQELMEHKLHALDFNIVATFLSTLKEETFIVDHCQVLLTKVFKNIGIHQWIVLLEQLNPKTIDILFETIGNENDIDTINHLLEILSSLNASSTKTLATFFQHHIHCMPTYLKNIPLSKLKDENKNKKEVIKEILRKVIELSHQKEQDNNWINDTTASITKTLTRNYVNDVLVVVASNKTGVLAKKIQEACIVDLTERIAVKPTPPTDWKRALPSTNSNQKLWSLLTPFIESPDLEIFEYRKIQSDRSAMESAINGVTVDLKMETIKKGSPHLLKITKTQASYERMLKKWEEDMAILKTMY